MFEATAREHRLNYLLEVTLNRAGPRTPGSRTPGSKVNVLGQAPGRINQEPLSTVAVCHLIVPATTITIFSKHMKVVEVVYSKLDESSLPFLYLRSKLGII